VDNNKTVVHITGGGGGGGGGGGPYTIEDGEGPGYTLADIERLRLATRRYQVQRVWADGFLHEGGFWFDPAFAYEIVGDEMIPQAVGNGTLCKAGHNGGQQQIGDGMSVTLDYTILTDDWDQIGIRIRDGAVLTRPALTLTIDRSAATMTLAYGATVIQQIDAGDGFTVPAIGMTRSMTLKIERFTESDPWWATGTDYNLSDINDAYFTEGDMSAVWQAQQPNPEIFANWSDEAALKFVNFKMSSLFIENILTLVVFNSDGDQSGEYGIISERGAGPDMGVTLNGELGWRVQDANGAADGSMCVLGGRLYSEAADPPAPGDAIGSVWPTPRAQMLLQVITGDDDGREWGAVSLDLGGYVRWEMGRSSDPATKHPYVVMDGVTFPMNRPW